MTSLAERVRLSFGWQDVRIALSFSLDIEINGIVPRRGAVDADVVVSGGAGK